MPDENDRHVLAAAIKCGAQHIVTENLRDFPEEILKQFDVSPIGADDFLSNTFELYPFAATAALRKMREAYKKPSFSASEFIMDLRRHRLLKLANLLSDKKALL